MLNKGMANIPLFIRRKHKYNVSDASQRTTNGIVFDSKWESKVYELLSIVVPKGHLHMQKAFVLQDKFIGPDGKTHRAISYVSDFVLGPDFEENCLDPRHVVLDCKGMITDVFKIKEKMFIRRYNTVIHKVATNKTAGIMDVVDIYKKYWQC